ncbi:hypothetical protein K440DRAFT_618898 [Wilcoxina mikolae CBS 423.85]|nr:hypothetical protein K440DRAFT_618898 [Wilcoxina mikolae CBS 423.85]
MSYRDYESSQPPNFRYRDYDSDDGRRPDPASGSSIHLTQTTAIILIVVIAFLVPLTLVALYFAFFRRRWKRENAAAAAEQLANGDARVRPLKLVAKVDEEKMDEVSLEDDDYASKTAGLEMEKERRKEKELEKEEGGKRKQRWSW